MRKAWHMAYVIVSTLVLLLVPVEATGQSIQDPEMRQLIAELRSIDADLADALTQLLSLSPEIADATGLDAMLRELLDGQVDAGQLNRILQSIGAGSVGVTAPVQLRPPSGAASGGGNGAGTGSNRAARPSTPMPTGRVGVVAPPPRQTAPERERQERRPAARPPSGSDGRRETRRPAEPSFADRVRAANERAAADFRRHARTIRITVYADQRECRIAGAYLSVNLNLEGWSAPKRGGITQYVTGAWFGDFMPYVEGFGGLVVPNNSSSAHGLWQNTFGCEPRTYVITYDTRRFPQGPHLRFTWSARYTDGRLWDNGMFTIRVRDGGRYDYRYAGGR